MYKKLIVVFLLLVVLISGCTAVEEQNNNEQLGNNSSESINADESSTEEDEVFSYFPLLEGMHYDYRGEGIEYAAFTRDIMYVDPPFVQVHDNTSGTTTALIYKVEANQIAVVSRQEEFYSDENLLAELDKEREVEEVILKTPIKKGTSWETNNKKKEIVETGIEVEVAVGKFYDVIKVKSESLEDESEMINYSYYAKNIALIKRDSFGENFEVISDLKGFEISN